MRRKKKKNECNLTCGMLMRMKQRSDGGMSYCFKRLLLHGGVDGDDGEKTKRIQTSLSQVYFIKTTSDALLLVCDDDNMSSSKTACKLLKDDSFSFRS